MKNLFKTQLLLFFSLVIWQPLFAQAPDGISYQAVVRDADGNLVQESPVSIRFTILAQGPEGEEVLQEEQTLQTNINGLVSAVIGQGTSTNGSLSTIDWSAGSYFLKTEVDPEGNQTYTITHTTQLLSVPYAMFANEAGNVFSGDYNDLLNKPQGNQPGDMMFWDGEQWVAVDAGQHGQTLTFCNGVPVWGPCDGNGGEPGQPEDFDGNVYETVVIGPKEWFAENLKSLHYTDGTPINGAFAPNGDDDMIEHYGMLYTWEAVMNGEEADNSNPGTVQGICPSGWRLPSDAEMVSLTEFLGGSSDAGGKLKSLRTAPQDHPRWNSPNSGANNQSGFTGYPAGRRNADGSFLGFGTGGYFWTSSQASADEAWGYLLYYSLTGYYKDSGTKSFGFSVRCVRDIE